MYQHRKDPPQEILFHRATVSLHEQFHHVGPVNFQGDCFD
jgi:hypothetical protein